MLSRKIRESDANILSILIMFLICFMHFTVALHNDWRIAEVFLPQMKTFGKKRRGYCIFPFFYDIILYEDQNRLPKQKRAPLAVLYGTGYSFPICF